MKHIVMYKSDIELMYVHFKPSDVLKETNQYFSERLLI